MQEYNQTELLDIKDFVSDGPSIVVSPAEHKGRGNQHTHSFCEIVYVKEGFTLHQSCGKMTMLIKGDLFFVRPGEIHSYINAYETKLYNLLFDFSSLGSNATLLSTLPGLDEMLSPAYGDCDPARRIIHVSMDERSDIEESLRSMLTEREEKECGWEVSLNAQLISFLVKYARMYSRQHSGEDKSTDSTQKSRMGNDYYGYIYKLLCFIDLHYSEELGMEELSEVTGLSPDYMTRKFKAILGMTPIEYLRKFRIAKAMELLVGTNLTVSEISDKVGFSDVSLFSRVFKQNAGVPPASYRKGRKG